MKIIQTTTNRPTDDITLALSPSEASELAERLSEIVARGHETIVRDNETMTTLRIIVARTLDTDSDEASDEIDQTQELVIIKP